jgi:hypothetical protein
MFSLSATAFLILIGIGLLAPGLAVPPSFRCGLFSIFARPLLDLFLRFMMRKSHSPDKRCPQGRLRGQHGPSGDE